MQPRRKLAPAGFPVSLAVAIRAPSGRSRAETTREYLINTEEADSNTTPDEVAPILVFLASDRAASLNGQIISFNGRKLALWTHPREVNIEIKPEAWTLDELRAEFFETAGREPQEIYKAVKRV